MTGSLVKRIGLPGGVEASWRGFTYDTRGRTDPVKWGENTTDEMCLGVVYVTE